MLVARNGKNPQLSTSTATICEDNSAQVIAVTNTLTGDDTYSDESNSSSDSDSASTASTGGASDVEADSGTPASMNPTLRHLKRPVGPKTATQQTPLEHRSHGLMRVTMQTERPAILDSDKDAAGTEIEVEQTTHVDGSVAASNPDSGTTGTDEATGVAAVAEADIRASDAKSHTGTDPEDGANADEST
ncbi:hypothetical protein BI49514_03145 [Brevibacterium iodinum ATCC 49514]|uniref:Uncharacterized protein n=1 Tax=Brevibacterium iodinum ATCC 49514 TaxID=1255616 RepID=A0A2H1KKY4_9MICO|nr:hypothetical protein BI49514_03145 [Brevibacterium iodinum ATCC 49514]SUW70194.1 Uncharacterised protein [Brevibacterium iodinum]